MAFLADTLAPLLEAAEAGQAVVYFADEAHTPRCTRAWTEKSPSTTPAHGQRPRAGEPERGLDHLPLYVCL